MIEFARFSRAEQTHVGTIVKRGVRLFRSVGHRDVRAMDLHMDLAAVHAQVPLRLADLAEADDANFGHDVSGIVRFIDRKTGKLGGHFHPRFAVRQGASV